ncbi:MAG: hypothetical protein KGI54_13545 [Pseudomonadota bacterium]|nr:hypothetical protein [Pseudomonadota bacterium]
MAEYYIAAVSFVGEDFAYNAIIAFERRYFLVCIETRPGPPKFTPTRICVQDYFFENSDEDGRIAVVEECLSISEELFNSCLARFEKADAVIYTQR